jgi:hypothetical protein
MEQPANRITWIGIAAVSAALLMTELALTRIFSVTMYYHFAFLAISIALFGLSASGVTVYVLRRRLAAIDTHALLAGGALLHADDASAKRRRRKNKKNKKGNQQSNSKRRQPGAFCDSSAQCQTDKGYICEVAVNAGNSDKTCSGGPGAVCGPKNEDLDDTAPFCAVGHECVNGVCQATPEEI